MTIYLIIGVVVSLYMIYHYRRDGTTNRKYELYWAVISPFIFPLLILKFIIDVISTSRRKIR